MLAATRYVKVLLSHLDMDGLHIQNDKHLYDAVRVWKEIGAKNTDITVYLDGDKDGNFEISKKTIAKINEINAATAAEKRSFKVMPCKDHECNTIVITGGGEIPADLTFILLILKRSAIQLSHSKTMASGTSLLVRSTFSSTLPTMVL